MSNNSSVAAVSMNERAVLVQVLVVVFLLINAALLATFFMQEAFYTTVRYIFFATTLTSDCLILFLTNVLLLHDYFRVGIRAGPCSVLFALSFVYTLVTPFTLTAMSLERYVAICMPLRHAELCSPRGALACVLLIHGLSVLPCLVTLLAVFASAPPGFYRRRVLCSAQVFLLHRWQGAFMAAVNQLYFLSMCVSIVFCYVQITRAARSASGEDRKSVWKGIKTVVLHAFQLLLCLIQLWCPFVEDAVLPFGETVFRNVRYFNYITFYLAPRCLSPLVYGLRDESFRRALRRYVLLGFRAKRSFH